ncbi:MAG: xylulokinase [Planctomycetota bacterium]|jgi:xylulokinase
MAVVLGIDVGTSGTRTLVVDEQGKVLGAASSPHTDHTPKPLWSEQEPEEWWTATVSSVKEALASTGVKPEDVKGIGLSGQMHGLVLLDEANNVLRRAILWNDQRTAEECDDITSAAGGRKALIDLVSNPALTGFTAPKILWVRKNEPEVYDKAKHVLLPKDYVRFRLTGDYATEVSDASGMLLLDVKKRAWSDELLSKLKIDKALLPKVYESPEVTGKLTAETAELLGLTPDCVVVGGGGDQAAGGVGNGIVKKGVVSATMGTSGVVFAHADEVQVDPEGRVHTFCHAVPGKWHVMGVVLSAGGSFQWFRNQLGAEERAEAEKRGVDPYEILTKMASKVPAGCEGLYFLPYLTGERTPHADPYARAAFIGLTPRHGKAEMGRAVMEGATYAMRDSFEIIRGMGVPISEARLSGGGARSPFWARMQAAIYGQGTCVTNSTEGGAYGVALLAGVGTGFWGSVEEACDATIKVTERFDVDPAAQTVYDHFYPLYGELYRALKDSFKRIAEVVG